MYIPLRGCCTDNPGCDDIATARQVYLTLFWVFAAATVAALALNLLLR
jgi:hypothetical protein